MNDARYNEAIDDALDDLGVFLEAIEDVFSQALTTDATIENWEVLRPMLGRAQRIERAKEARDRALAGARAAQIVTRDTMNKLPQTPHERALGRHFMGQIEEYARRRADADKAFRRAV